MKEYIQRGENYLKKDTSRDYTSPKEVCWRVIGCYQEKHVEKIIGCRQYITENSTSRDYTLPKEVRWRIIGCHQEKHVEKILRRRQEEYVKGLHIAKKGTLKNYRLPLRRVCQRDFISQIKVRQEIYMSQKK